MKDFSYVFNAHPSYIESIYQQYSANPESVDEGWRTFFQGFEFAQNGNGSATNGQSVNGHSSSAQNLDKEFGVQSIIHGYRDRGHLLSTTNPIRQRRDRRPHLALADYKLEDSDLSKVFQAGKEIGLENGTLQQILDRLRLIYCGNIGFEYAHIEKREKRMWLRDKIENRAIEGFGLDVNKKRRILEKLNGAVIFERFLHT